MTDRPTSGGDSLPDDPDQPGEPEPLGAAPTIRVGRGGDRPNRPEKPKRRKLPVVLVLLLAVVVVGALAAVPALSTAVAKTPRDRVGISYGGGPIEGVHFQRIVQPGSNLFVNGLFDSLFLYPSDQRSYVVAPSTNSDGTQTIDFIAAPTSDRVQVNYQVAVFYKLNTEAGRLRQFHEQLGLRYNAFTNSGWDQLIVDTFRRQLEGAIQEVTRGYTVDDLYGNAEALTEVQTAVQQRLGERIIAALGAQYFCGPDYAGGDSECTPIAVVVTRIDPPASVVSAFEAQRSAEISIAQRENEARAIEALSDALEQAGDDYVLLRAIESGAIKFWVLPSDSGLTLQAPGTSDGSAPSASDLSASSGGSSGSGGDSGSGDSSGGDSSGGDSSGGDSSGGDSGGGDSGNSSGG